MSRNSGRPLVRNAQHEAICRRNWRMVVEPSKDVWKGKWAEVTESFNSDGDLDDEGAGEEVSLGANQRNDEDCNGNEIRRSARPRRIAAKVAEADFSSMSDEDERPLKRRTSLSASATPSRGRSDQRRQLEGQRSNASKLDEKRMRKRETNKNSARKMRLQRKEELNSLLRSRNELQDQLGIKSRELRTSQNLLQSMEKNYGILDSNYKTLAQSHDMLVVELLRHFACLKSQLGKPLEPPVLTQMLTQLAPFLPKGEEEGPLGESILAASKLDLSELAASSSGLSAGLDEGAETLLIQVNPKPGTQVQIFRPKALRAQQGSHSLPTEIGKISPQFSAVNPLSSLSRQLSNHHPHVHSLSAAHTEQGPHLSPTNRLPLRGFPQTPHSFAPPVKSSPSPAEGSAPPKEGTALRLKVEGDTEKQSAAMTEVPQVPSEQKAGLPKGMQSGPAHSTAYISPHQVIRPQARSASGPSDLSSSPTDPLAFKNVDAAAQNAPTRAQASGPTKLLGLESHLSGFRPVPRLA